MKQFIFLPLLGAMMLLSAFTFKKSISWKIQEGYSIKFVSKDPTGVFKKMEGSILFDENDLPNSSFNVKVEVSSINTGKGMQNKHAVSSKWFDAEKYPYIHFVSDEISKTASGFKASGQMEIKGIKKRFDIPFSFSNNVFEGSFPVNRNDFGIGKPGGKVPDEIAVEVSVPVSK